LPFDRKVLPLVKNEHLSFRVRKSKTDSTERAFPHAEAFPHMS
jgi:hypothetical protein